MNRMTRLLAGLFLGLHAALAHAAAPACDDPTPLRFSLIPRTDLAQQLEDHRPLLQHLERALGRKIMVVQPSSYSTVIEGLLAGTIDLASMGPASYSIAKNRDPSITAFVTWTMQGGTFVKAGAHTYRSLLIVRRDSGLKDIADLQGRSVSLTDPASTSGAVIPSGEFGGQVGKRLKNYFGRVTFSGSHDRSIEVVKKGYADAAFVASEHLDEAIHQGRINAREIRVLWQSRPIPHDPIVFRGKLCPELRKRISQAFLADSPDVRAMLANVRGERFIPVTDADYQHLRDLLTREQ
ncbi:phosphate/phosphite/phosphonate ABC transporter substrate-binding protein [Thiobacillus sp.]|uniref:phosphate/phosphite/phosphonate ABC transporter substrate-binding protein n=1 Tax=Thiobacillus sp. TaxID=924 RepID=UPI0025E1F0C0|nr:phosphate/phosphite/phosphonate ABC transporter substrate-binding protein [Thiobacillus sp.]MBT9538349.1 phosphate/phosphite/phosphonate ABC transporter substrate-binding protein [Thiobacillus sp.]